jgi:hypothetical protein
MMKRFDVNWKNYLFIGVAEMVCQMLENSCKKEKSEENLSLCFMSYVRVSCSSAALSSRGKPK